jgi:hypothetical protein
VKARQVGLSAASWASTSFSTQNHSPRLRHQQRFNIGSV